MKNEESILKALMAITQISNRPGLGFEAKLQKIIHHVTQCMRTEKGSIMLVKGRRQLEVAASTNTALIGIRNRIESNSPSAWVVKNKKLLCIDERNTQTDVAKGAGKYNKDAFLLAPILNRNKVVGVLSVTEKIGEDCFTKTEQEIFFNIAGHVISALENRRLNDSLKRSKQKLQRQNAQLKKLEQVRTELFNMLVHDLKGPISEIMANVDILSYTVVEENREYVESARIGCDNLYRMVSNLLDIARMEDHSLSLIIEKLTAAELIDEAVARLHGVSQAKQVALATAIDVSVDEVFVKGDRDLLLRVLQNLLLNAIEHSRQDDTVEIGVAMADKDLIRFYIADNGPGISPAHQDVIFDKYTQIKKKKDGIKYSTGLGLTFCKLAIEAHKGAVNVESDGMQGSRFVIDLPVRLAS